MPGTAVTGVHRINWPQKKCSRKNFPVFKPVRPRYRLHKCRFFVLMYLKLTQRQLLGNELIGMVSIQHPASEKSFCEAQRMELQACRAGAPRFQSWWTMNFSRKAILWAIRLAGILHSPFNCEGNRNQKHCSKHIALEKVTVNCAQSSDVSRYHVMLSWVRVHFWNRYGEQPAGKLLYYKHL